MEAQGLLYKHPSVHSVTVLGQVLWIGQEVERLQKTLCPCKNCELLSSV